VHLSFSLLLLSLAPRSRSPIISIHYFSLLFAFFAFEDGACIASLPRSSYCLGRSGRPSPSSSTRRDNCVCLPDRDHCGPGCHGDCRSYTIHDCTAIDTNNDILYRRSSHVCGDLGECSASNRHCDGVFYDHNPYRNKVEGETDHFH
jgi:hypothetical protein